MGQIAATRNLLATKVVRLAGQWNNCQWAKIHRSYDDEKYVNFIYKFSFSFSHRWGSHFQAARILLISWWWLWFFLHDVIKWKQFSMLLALCVGNSPVTGEGQWCGAFMFSLICAWTQGWINNRDAGDLRRHPAHYDIIVMFLSVA